METILRYYQNEAIDAINENYLAGITRQILCMATGSGKTEVFAHLPTLINDKLPGQMMVLVHRDELAKQAYKKLKQRNPGLNIQIEAGSRHADRTADVIVASVQTLGRQGSKRAEEYDYSNIDKLVVDEAHRSIAPSYLRIYDRLDPNTLILGVTATPTRGDGQGLGSVYQKIVYSYDLRKAIEDGFLVDVRGIKVDTNVSLDGVHIKGGEYDQKELSATVNNPVRNNLACSVYIQHCEGRQAIGFTVDVQHAKNLAKVFQDRGVNAEWVSGNDPDRFNKIQAYRDGKIDVLFNAQLLMEGFDLATIECVIMCAPTKSGVVFSQRVGRGTRLNPPFKKDCIVLDLVDASSRHSLITLPTLLGLPSGLNLKGRGLVEAIQILEEQLEAHPHIDFSNLTDIDQVEAFVENVNLFEIKIPKEVEENSRFTWHPHYTGGYVLMFPDKSELHIKQNLLDSYEIYGKLKGKKYRGERKTLNEAFSAADDLVRKVFPESLTLFKKDAKWRDEPATEKQITRIKQMYKGKQIPPDLTKGAANNLIAANMAGKKRPFYKRKYGPK